MTGSDGQAAGGAARDPIDITFIGSATRLLGLGATNGILKILTLGLYSFWAKTEVRRRIWSATRLNGEPLRYTGTGKELFLGFLIVFGAVMLPATLGAVGAVMFGGKAALTNYQLLLYLAFFLVIGNAIYRAQRYRLSRTEWRGIRGALVGSPGAYGWTYFWTLALPAIVVFLVAASFAYMIGPAVGGVIVVIGGLLFLWVFPWRANLLQARMTHDMRFGDRPLTYTGTAGPLYKRYGFAWLGNALIFAIAAGLTGMFVMQNDRYITWFVLKERPPAGDLAVLAGLWLAALIASAIVTSWYRASQTNHFARHTHFEGATFRAEATGASLMWLVLSNWLLSLAAIFVGAAIGTLLMYQFSATLSEPDIVAELRGGPSPADGLLGLALFVPPVVLTTTLATTFAQFRAARYFLSRLKLDGAVDLAAILQGRDKIPARGEGLAQAFDLDAF